MICWGRGESLNNLGDFCLSTQTRRNTHETNERGSIECSNVLYDMFPFYSFLMILNKFLTLNYFVIISFQTQLQQTQPKVSGGGGNGSSGSNGSSSGSNGGSDNINNNNNNNSNNNNYNNSSNNNNNNNNSTLTTLNGHNKVTVEQKPVECNLCHRKFKNVPALNGHMRLHGGYFKKDSETKKNDRKESNGPPLQTASVGVRALIEEKIINKRGKDLKGSFVVPAPPLTARRLLEAESYAKMSTNSSTVSAVSNTIAIVTTTSGNGTGAITNITQTSNNSHAIVNNTHGSTITQHKQSGQRQGPHTHMKATTVTKATNGIKDATLIELLKRGTKVAVKRACSDPGQRMHNNAHSKILSLNPTTISTPATPVSTPPLALSLTGGNGNSAPLLTISQGASGTSEVYALAYSTDSSTAFYGDNDVYGDTAMLLQAVDTIQLLNDTATTEQLNEIAALTDYAINGDSSLNQNFTPSRQLQAVLDSPLPDSLAEFSTLHSKDFIVYANGSSESPQTQSSNSPLPSPLAYPTPPASHEAIAQASPFLDDSHHFSDASSFFDDKKTNSFLEEDSPFFKDTKDSKMTDNERIFQLKQELFDDSKDVLCDDSNVFFRNNKNILDDQSELFKNEDDDNFDFDAKSDITSHHCHSQHHNHQDDDDDTAAKLRELDFLDEPQAFIDDGRNTSSPLSAAFFSATMSSAEEVKEALEEVLPNEDDDPGADIDLYYLPSFPLQSQMMPNSDDPLLSSSPKDFVHRQQPQKFIFDTFTSAATGTPPIAINPKKILKSLGMGVSLPITISSTDLCHQPSVMDGSLASTITTTTLDEMIECHSDRNKIPLTVQTEQIPKDNNNNESVFLSPSSLSSASMCSNSNSSSPKLQNVLLSSALSVTSSSSFATRKRTLNDMLSSTSSLSPPHCHHEFQFKSKFCKLTNTFRYTPTPILNPERHAPGLFSSIPQNQKNLELLEQFDNSNLNSCSEFNRHSNFDFTEEDVMPITPKINIGCEYQAFIPDCIIDSDRSKYCLDDVYDDEQLLWEPNCNQNEKQLQRFIELAKSSAIPLGSHSEEMALKALLDAQGEIHIAVLSLLQAPTSVTAAIHKRWSTMEMELFLKGLETYGKDFYKIAKEISDKTTGDCVQLYYFWKKLCIDYKKTHLYQNNMKSLVDDNYSNDSLLLDCSNIITNTNHTHLTQNNELRPHVCDVPDCSAVSVNCSS